MLAPLDQPPQAVVEVARDLALRVGLAHQLPGAVVLVAPAPAVGVGEAKLASAQVVAHHLGDAGRAGGLGQVADRVVDEVGGAPAPVDDPHRLALAVGVPDVVREAMPVPGRVIDADLSGPTVVPLITTDGVTA